MLIGQTSYANNYSSYIDNHIYTQYLQGFVLKKMLLTRKALAIHENSISNDTVMLYSNAHLICSLLECSLLPVKVDKHCCGSEAR